MTDLVAEAYMQGAVMAYEDAADFVSKLAKDLPIEVAFFAPTLDTIATGMHEKAQNVKTMTNESKSR